jgi:hypothetical protein
MKLEELKQEIIDELNEWLNKTSPIQSSSHYVNKNFYYETLEYGTTNIAYLNSENIIEFDTGELPLKLAHKITTYFMRLENENE